MRTTGAGSAAVLAAQKCQLVGFFAALNWKTLAAAGLRLCLYNPL
jgi:hypothetical protein